ncbi:MAG: hypothetical protein UT11_C0021G0001, partial [Berkelbacteria bacterium GW2011_GWA2_38_9]
MSSRILLKRLQRSRIMKRQLIHSFKDIISIDNLLLSWQEFIKGKRLKSDVLIFQDNLIDNILALYRDLSNFTYRHSSYQSFNISDPKPRIIHKATVRDRLVHRAIYQKLYPFFDRTFISDSYSCRIGKGTYKALDQFRKYANKVSQNNTKTCWVLQCDIRKFFASVDHQNLFDILTRYIPDQNILKLLKEVIGSFNTQPGIGLPLGNLTSQLLANVYLNEFDHFAKHKLKAQFYIRYADDFVVLSDDKLWLNQIIPVVQRFLQDQLKLTLHPNKVTINTLTSGIDFLGYVTLPHCWILRTKTKRRMLRRVNQENIESYRGLLKHCDGHKL